MERFDQFQFSVWTVPPTKVSSWMSVQLQQRGTIPVSAQKGTSPCRKRGEAKEDRQKSDQKAAETEKNDLSLAVPKRGRSKRSRTQKKSANEHKRAQTQVRKRAQKGAKECKRVLLRKNCKQTRFEQPGLGTPSIASRLFAALRAPVDPVPLLVPYHWSKDHYTHNCCCWGINFAITHTHTRISGVEKLTWSSLRCFKQTLSPYKNARLQAFFSVRYRVFRSLEKANSSFKTPSPKPHLNRTRSVSALPSVSVTQLNI